MTPEDTRQHVAPRGVLAHVEWALARLVAAALFLMMMLTFLDVFGRYVLNAPLPGAFEITELSMGVLVFAALPLLTRPDSHIALDLLAVRFPPWLMRVQLLAVALFSAFVLAGLSWQIAQQAASEAAFGYTTMTLNLPTWPTQAAMSGFAALAALFWLARGISAFRQGGTAS